MLRFENIIYGPVHSRRLGNSLGINVLPHDGKLCNFDCIYCECGWNSQGRTSTAMPSAAEVSAAIEDSLHRCSENGIALDSITFAGNGEPTLHPEFSAIIDVALMLRDRYCPGAALSVLSNATTLSRPDVVSALRRVDNPILKLDAPTDELATAVNCPCGHYSVAAVVEGMMQFDGDFILQTMFLSGAKPDYCRDTPALEQWMDIVRRLRPRKVMVYTIDRPAPMKGLGKVSAAKMSELLQPLADEGFDIQING